MINGYYIITFFQKKKKNVFKTLKRIIQFSKKYLTNLSFIFDS